VIAEVVRHMINVTTTMMAIDGNAPRGAAAIGIATYDIGKLTNATNANASQKGGRFSTLSSPLPDDILPRAPYVILEVTYSSTSPLIIMLLHP
jgi:hypothetical protein